MNRSITLWASLCCCLAAAAESADFGNQGPGTLPEGAVVSFQNGKSGLCIGVDGASTAVGALLKQFGCSATAPNQRWRVHRDELEHFFKNVKSGHCMGVTGASKSPGANIGQYRCGGNGTHNQGWLRFFNNQLENVNSQLCIGVDGASTAPGAQLKQFGCGDHNAPNQQWIVIFR